MSSSQTVLITGASGIGLEFARLFHAKGYNLVVASLLQKELDALKEALDSKSFGQTVQTFQCDLATPDGAAQVLQFCDAMQVKVDILINNAGFGLYGEHLSLSPESIQKMLSLNIQSLTMLCSLFGQRMKNQRQGYILNVASTAAYQPFPFMAAYGASKSYVLNFTQALAIEMKKFGVTVSCLAPGATRTKFFQAAGIAGQTRPGTLGMWLSMTPEQVAKCGYKALFDKKLTAVPGLRNRLMTTVTHLLPTTLILETAHRLMKHS